MHWPTKLALALSALVLSGAAATAQSSGIQVRDLGAVDPFQVGVGGGLSDAAWNASEAEGLRALFERLPDGSGEGWTQPLAARLAERALMSSGAPPRGARDDFELAALRADRALAAGRAGPVYALLNRTPRINESATLSRLLVETAFASGDREAACRAADALLDGRDSPYWLRARAACLAYSGAIPAAELTAELARSSGVDAPVFDALLDAYVLDGELPANAVPTNGLELALAASAAPAASITVAEDAPVWLRRAASRTGPQISLPPDPVGALEAIEALSGPEREAALGALIQQDADRAIAAEALAQRLSSATEAGRFVEVARAYGEEVSTLPITAATLSSGEAFAFAALLAGDTNAARRWRRALEQGPPPAPRTSAADIGGLISQEGAGQLRPMPSRPVVEPQAPFESASPEVLVRLDFAIAIAENGLRRSDFGALLAARAETEDAQRLREIAALTALGQSPPAQVTARMMSEPLISGANPVGGLLAARARARGEAMLHAAAILEADSVTMSGAYLATRILAEAGLESEARRVIVEMISEHRS
ncbi:MAG: hypothetical protein AAFX09_09660 [Pseudomonadota bacterium]